MSFTPKIAVFDLENAPLLTHSWRTYDANALSIEEDWYLLSFAYKWYGQSKTHVKALCDYPKYDYTQCDDSLLVKDLWKLFDEADILIAHNGDKFDVKKANARFIKHVGKPPSPYKTIDTLKIARTNFNFTSNKLDYLAKYLGVGEKLKHQGFPLWVGCMNGVKKDWNTMKKYNKIDVDVLEKVYDELRAWSTSGTNIGLFVDDGTHVCPKCGSTDLQKRGFAPTNSGIYQRYQCKCCGGWSRSREKVANSGNPLTHIGK